MLLAADQDHIGHLHHQAGNLIATQAAFAAIVQYTAGPKTQKPFSLSERHRCRHKMLQLHMLR